MVLINNILKPSLVQRHSLLHLYKTSVWPILCYGSEVQIITSYQHNYSLKNDIHVKNSRLYQMGSQKKCGHLR